jgi:hypothetical protein
VKVQTRIGSDHCSLLVDSREGGAKRSNIIYVEKHWCLQPEFKDFVIHKWHNALIAYSEDGSAIDCWNHCSRSLRRSLRVWQLIGRLD